MRMSIRALCAVAFLALAPFAAAENLVVPTAGTASGSIGQKLITAASNNATLIKASPGVVYGLTVNSTGTGLAFLKFYDLSSTPTCTAQPATQTFLISANALPLSMNLGAVGMGFGQGISICVTGAQSDSDNSSAAAGIIIDFIYR